MEIKELFKSFPFVIGFILGVAFIIWMVNYSLVNGFQGDFIWYYIIILGLTFLSTEGDDMDPPGFGFMFFLGLGVFWSIIILCIFYTIDYKNKKKKRNNDN